MPHRPLQRKALVRFTALAVVAVTASCVHDGAENGTLASLRVGVAAPVIRQSATQLALSYHRSALSRETLLGLAGDGRPIGRVLESWDESDDGLTWRLVIREEARFHDGSRVTSNEIVPILKSGLIAGLLGKLRSVAAVDARTIVVELREPFAFLPEDLAQLTAEKAVDGQRFGTGAYSVVSESGDHLQLKSVPGHYRGEPALEQIDVQLFPDQRNAWSALMRDEIDVLYEVGRDSVDFVRNETSVVVKTLPRGYVYLLGFNSSHRSLADQRVRQALNHAVDRSAFIRSAMAGEGRPADGHIWPEHWAHDATVRAPAYDPARAVQLLESAGLDVRYQDGSMPARLRLKCIVYEPFQKMALVVQRQLAEVDIDLQLELEPLERYLARISQGDYETFLFEMTSGRTLLWPYMFWHSASPFLKHGYAGADDILQRMASAVSERALRTATSEFQQRLATDPPAVFLAWGRTSRAVSNRFEVPDGDEDIYLTIARWKPAAKGAN